MGHRMKEDGRWLYKINLDDSYTKVEADELQEVFMEALAPFAAHLKTPESAKVLAEKLTTRPYEVKGSLIEDVGPKEEMP